MPSAATKICLIPRKNTRSCKFDATNRDRAKHASATSRRALAHKSLRMRKPTYGIPDSHSRHAMRNNRRIRNIPSSRKGDIENPSVRMPVRRESERRAKSEKKHVSPQSRMPAPPNAQCDECEFASSEMRAPGPAYPNLDRDSGVFDASSLNAEKSSGPRSASLGSA